MTGTTANDLGSHDEHHHHHHHHHDDPNVEAIAPDWTDGKRYAWLLGLVVPTIPFIAWGLVEATGLGIFWWFGPLFVFGVMPLMDQIGGNDTTNPPESVIKWLENDHFYRWCTYLFIPIQLAATVFAAWMWSTGNLSVLESIGLAISLGTVNGIAIADAHELGHKREQLEKWLARVALAPTFYGHFMVEHNRGHHVRVATPEDPASARYGEGFWRFLPRTLIGSFIDSLRIDKGEVMRVWAATFALAATLGLAFGPLAVAFFFGQSAMAVMLLEAVNYIEHYGLERRKLPDGRYERQSARHAWDAYEVLSNSFLVHLQRHADHHLNPMRPYAALQPQEESPKLPTGYAGMVPIALVPPLWFAVMNPRVPRG